MPLDAETRGPRVRSEAFRVEEAVASGAAAEHEFFLATLPPTLRQRRMALAVVLVLFIAVIVVAPFRAIQLPQSATVVAVMQATVLINDLVTATLLYAQYAVLRWRSLLLLAGLFIHNADLFFVFSQLSRLFCPERPPRESDDRMAFLDLALRVAGSRDLLCAAERRGSRKEGGL